MTAKLIVVGDANLVSLSPNMSLNLRRQLERHDGDVLFGNLECMIADTEELNDIHIEGFVASVDSARTVQNALQFDVVGNANNVNYGAEKILASNEHLDHLGITHCGSGANRHEAEKGVIIEQNGVKIGVLQRTSVYWPTAHEAGANTPGVASLKAHTAYVPPIYRRVPGVPAFNRPGIPPDIVTWVDNVWMGDFQSKVESLRAECDFLLVSYHWGLGLDVLEYMEQAGRAAIDAGADMVVGHGPHMALPIEFYRGRPIFYGLGSFLFNSGHGEIVHSDWIGIAVSASLDLGEDRAISMKFIKHHEVEGAMAIDVGDAPKEFERLARLSAVRNVTITTEGAVRVK